MYLLADSITDADRAAYGELAIRVLDMLTLYDRVLDVIWWFARDSLLRDATQESEDLALSHFARGRDGDQGALFVRLADRMGVPGDRSHFVNVFKRLKGARDHVAHASAMNAMTEEGGAPSIGIPYYHQQRARLGSLEGGRSSITPRLVRNRIREAEWLIEHVDWCRVHLGQFGGPYALDDNPPTEAPSRLPAR